MAHHDRRTRRRAGRRTCVDRDFTAGGPDRLWVADISYLRCWEGLVFFAFVLDVYSRADRRLAARRRTCAPTLVLDALRMALARRAPAPTSSWCTTPIAAVQPGLNRSSQQLSVR